MGGWWREMLKIVDVAVTGIKTRRIVTAQMEVTMMQMKARLDQILAAGLR